MNTTRRQAFSLLAASALATAFMMSAPVTALASTGAIPQDVANLGAPDRELEARLAALAGALDASNVGIAAVDLSGGRTAFLREGELFPMQGVSALPIAVACLRLAEQGALDLDALVPLSADDISPGRSPMAAKLRAKPVRYTGRQLIEHMLLNADNTATDALLRLAGGPSKVQQVLVKTGYLQGLRVDRYEREIQPAVFGLKPDARFSNPADFNAAVVALGQEQRGKALARYLQDARDTASPRAIASLYTRLASGHLLDLQDTDFILDLLRRTKMGSDRLHAGMGKGWQLAHRSGQTRSVDGITATFNDSGLATSKAGGKIALVVFIEGARVPAERLEAFQAKVAATVIEAWGKKPAPAPKS